MSEFRKRILEPLSLPVFAAIFIAILVFSASRILLAVEEAASTVIALVLAAEVLGVCAVLAAATRLKQVQKVILGVIGLSLIGGGAAGASIGVREIEKHGVEVTVVAKNIAFTPQDVEFPPDEEFDLVFVNNDAGVPHNVNVFADDSKAESVAKTEIFNGIATRTTTVEPLEAKIYPFICDVHPQMTGRLIPEGTEAPPATASPTAPASPTATATPTESPSPSPSPSAPAGEAPTSVDISANQLAFSVSEFTLAANTEVTINFDNQEPQPHNLSIYPNEDFTGTPVLQEQFFTGPKKVTWTFTSPAPGTWYFKCDVHPNMKGTTIFR